MAALLSSLGEVVTAVMTYVGTICTTIIDKKLRDLCDEMYIVGKFARVLVRAKRIIRKPVVVHPSPEAPARIDEDLIVDGPLMAFFGGRIYAWIPYWAKTFNSFKKV